MIITGLGLLQLDLIIPKLLREILDQRATKVPLLLMRRKIVRVFTEMPGEFDPFV